MTKAIVFDLDGTLIDSAPDLHQASNRLLADLDTEPLSLETIRSFVGNGVPKLVERVLKARDLYRDEARHASMVTQFLAHYDAALHDKTVLYPGVVDCLDALKAQGFSIGICTNKPEAQTRAIVKGLDLERFVGAIIGGDSLPVKKPAIEPLQETLRQLGLGVASSSDDVIYVGDSEVDAATAKAAEIPFFLFTDGYRKSPINQLPHTVAFNDYAELEYLINSKWS
ncbi:phosphoglycolate phosphatase [Cohaesibacter gelatinilyticus]|uniref:Phosphoglycolate phosphatase n=1 Tax=Cohaesibacter gelatinilyticus TaxID=372072 RepID=A0A285PFS1_9HYPH|nr:phosphoglycolate phosphatase [Cohaesibacter gelatinilyticus]SNZ20298.1 phosphoglycolate phosphatase [Cohaesibacter gelatinilyticus]